MEGGRTRARARTTGQHIRVARAAAGEIWAPLRLSSEAQRGGYRPGLWLGCTTVRCSLRSSSERKRPFSIDSDNKMASCACQALSPCTKSCSQHLAACVTFALDSIVLFCDPLCMCMTGGGGPIYCYYPLRVPGMLMQWDCAALNAGVCVTKPSMHLPKLFLAMGASTCPGRTIGLGSLHCGLRLPPEHSILCVGVSLEWVRTTRGHARKRTAKAFA